MPRTEHRKTRTTALLVCVLLLVVFSMVMIFRVFAHNEEVLLQNEDSHLMGLAHSVDRSVVSYLIRYANDLTYVTGQADFQADEALWQTTGNSIPLLSRLESKLTAQYQMTSDVLILQDGQPILSISGRTDYHFPEQICETNSVPVWSCLDGDGTIYIAFLKENGSGVTYASLLDLNRFYQRVAGDLTAETQEQIMLLTVGGQILIHKGPEGLLVENANQLSPAQCMDYEGVRLLLDGGTREHTAFCKLQSSERQQTYTARMAILPAPVCGNSAFSIGVSSNYDQFIHPVRSSTILLLVYGGIVVAGVLLLFLRGVQSDRKNRLVLQEVAALQEKNAAMEALNAKTQELAHHQRLETIGTLTSSIAHEFNNLLTPIMGYSILSLEKLSAEETEIYDNLLEIYQSSCKAKDIISRLSALSRKNTGLTYQKIDPDELVRKVLSVAAPAQPPQVDIQTQLHASGCYLFGNETQLSQVLLNLILNAFHAMEKTGGTLILSTQKTDTQVQFCATDTGCGISKENLPHIFDPFFTTKETGRGTGLGLAIVQQVLDEHKGTVHVDSRLGEGSRFTVSLPIYTSSEL